MKKNIPIFTTCLLLCVLNTNAQFGKLKDVLNNGVGNLLNSKQLKMLQSDPITTNFDDCNKTDVLPVNFGTDSVKKSLCTLVGKDYNAATGFTLKPGFYTGVFKSFCLKAGTYGPGSGDAYLYAPLAGPKEKIARTMIANWEQHPEVDQSKVQVLLWAIIAKTNFSKLAPEYQLAAAKLLNQNDLSALGSSIMDYLSSEAMLKITANLPEPAKTIVEIENKMRGLLYQANTSYAELESLAMLGGAAPSNTEFQRGIWGLHPDGYYIKYLPRGYSQTEVVIYVPQTKGTVTFLPVGDVAVPASRGSQRLGQSNLLICKEQ